MEKNAVLTVRASYTELATILRFYSTDPSRAMPKTKSTLVSYIISDFYNILTKGGLTQPISNEVEAMDIFDRANLGQPIRGTLPSNLLQRLNIVERVDLPSQETQLTEPAPDIEEITRRTLDALQRNVPTQRDDFTSLNGETPQTEPKV